MMITALELRERLSYVGSAKTLEEAIAMRDAFLAQRNAS